MLAIFKTGGKQYSVKAGQVVKVEKLEGKKGDNISFENVLALGEASNYTLGSPIVEGARVNAKILEQIRDKKIIVFKKRRRQNYRHTQGHRQYLTVVKIESIDLKNKKISSKNKETVKKTDDKKNKSKDMKVSKKTAPRKKNTTIKKTVKKKTALNKKTTK